MSGPNLRRLVPVIFTLILVTSSVGLPQVMAVEDAGRDSIDVFSVYEVELTAQTVGPRPYLDGPSVSAMFVGPGRQTFVVPGFWDGGDTYRVRFAPPKPGLWRYRTTSTDGGLDGVEGSLTARPASPATQRDNPLVRGFLRTDGHAFALSDGSAFLPVGDTQWSFTDEFTVDEWKQWVDVLEEKSINSFLGTVWLAVYNRAQSEPFTNGDPTTDELLPAFFRQLDERVAYANGHGVMMGLSIGGFPGNSNWFRLFGNGEAGRQRHDAWWRYVVARYAAYNVRWLLFGESDEAVGSRLPRWDYEDTVPDGVRDWRDLVAYYAALTKEVDPFDHPVGTHLWIGEEPVVTSDIDYIEVQSNRASSEQYLDALKYRAYGRPIWYEEYWYEGPTYNSTIPDAESLGIRNTHRNFVTALAFPTIGSLMRTHSNFPEFPPTVAAQRGITLYEYLREEDRGLDRMADFARFYAGLDYAAFQPADPLVDRGHAGRFGDEYAIFVPDGGVVQVDLRDATGWFCAAALEVQTGSVRSLGTVRAGQVLELDTQASTDVSVVLRTHAVGCQPGAAHPRGGEFR